MVEKVQPLCEKDWVHTYVNWLACNLKKYKMVAEGIDEQESFSFTVHIDKGKILKMVVTR